MDSEAVIKELKFKAVRSSGPGGQHVNKTSSRVEAVFSIPESIALSDEEKARLLKVLETRLTKEGNLRMQCDESRSQHRNKAILIDRVIELLASKLKTPKKRKKTKPSRKAIEKRLKEKKQTALKKSQRRKPNLD